jgi:hypothetical protein
MAAVPIAVLQKSTILTVGFHPQKRGFLRGYAETEKAGRKVA